MRKVLMVVMVGLLAGCQTTGTTGKKSIAERRAEIERYREEQARQAAEKQAAAEQRTEGQGSQATAGAQAAGEKTGTVRPSGEVQASASPVANAPVSSATGPVGARADQFGIRASLMGGSGLVVPNRNEASVATLGFRYFATDSVALDLDGGLLAVGNDTSSALGLNLGARVNVYGGTASTSLRPFFAGEVGFAHVGGSETRFGSDVSSEVNVLSAGLGGGLEYWVLPQLSVSARLMAGFAYNLTEEAYAVGTFTPALGVTLYAP